MDKIKAKFVRYKETGLFSIFGSSVAVKVFSFISSIVLVRLVTKAEYGIFTYSWNIYSIVMLFTGFGSLYAVLQICCENPNDNSFKEKVYRYGWIRGLVFNLIIGIIMLLIGLLFPFKMNGVGILLAAMCFLPIIQYGAEYQSVYFRTERKNNLFSISNIVNVIFVLVFSAIGAIFLKEKGFIIGRYIAYFILMIVGFTIWNVPYKFKKTTLEQHEKKDFKKVAHISMFNSGISQLLYLIDVLILGFILENESIVASFKIATIIPTALSFIPAALTTYIYPFFAENRNNKKWCLEKYKKMTIVIGCINLFIVIVGIIFAPTIISIMYGNEYLDAIIPFRILMVSYFFSGTFRTIAGNLLVTQRKLMFNTFVAIMSGIVNIIADVVLIMNYGSNGAAVATLCVVIISSGLNAIYLLKILSSKEKEI